MNQDINTKNGKRILVFNSYMSTIIRNDNKDFDEFNIDDTQSRKPTTISPFFPCDIARNKMIAIFIAIFPMLFFLPLIMEKRKTSSYLKYYMNTGLALTILYVTYALLVKLLSIVAFVGLLCELILLAILVLHITNIVCASHANNTNVPLIGNLSVFK